MFVSVLGSPEQEPELSLTLTAEELGTMELTLLSHSDWGQVIPPEASVTPRALGDREGCS